MVCVLVTVLVLAGLLYSRAVGDRLRFPDEREYMALATHLADEHAFSVQGTHPTAYRPPGYPMFLSAFVAWGARPIHLRALNYAALGATLVLLYLTVLRHGSPVAAIFAAVGVVGYPGLFYTAGTLYPQTVAALVFLLILYLLTGPWAPQRACAAAGLLLGGLILTVPTFATVLVIVPLWFALYRMKAWLRSFPLTALIAACVVAVWSGRNYVVFHAFVPVSTNGGINLLLGNSEHTGPNDGTQVDIRRYRDVGDQLGEVERDRYYRAQAFAYMRAHKVESLKRYALKFLNHFHYRNNLATQTENTRIADMLMLATYGPLLGLVLVRLGVLARVPLSRFEVLCLALYLANAACYAIFFTRIRFRLPHDYLLIAVAALFLDRIVRAWAGMPPTREGDA